MINIPDKSLEQIKHTFYVQYIFFFDNRAIYEIMWRKYSKAGQVTDDNIAQAYCNLDT